MADINRLLEQNRTWAAAVLERDPQFFMRLAEGQHPDYLWIGCSDSRVSAARATGLEPGEMFVHRNVANLVQAQDVNCQSVIKYAVEVLKVEHIIVCGHYGCGGVKAACDDQQHGLLDDWLRPITALHQRKAQLLAALPSDSQREDLMCELNVRAQVQSLCRTGFVQEAWGKGQRLFVHGWIYGLQDGLLNSLEGPVGNSEELLALEKDLDA